MPFGIGPGELLIVLALALLILGPKRLPEAGRSLGGGLREFRESVSGRKRDEDDGGDAGATASGGDDGVRASRQTVPVDHAVVVQAQQRDDVADVGRVLDPASGGAHLAGEDRVMDHAAVGE